MLNVIICFNKQFRSCRPTPGIKTRNLRKLKVMQGRRNGSTVTQNAQNKQLFLSSFLKRLATIETKAVLICFYRSRSIIAIFGLLFVFFKSIRTKKISCHS